MRHKKQRYQLNRFTSWHEATIKSIARNLLIHQSIKTTLSKAKSSRPLVEKLITLAKRNNLSSKRQAAGILNDHKLVSRLLNITGPLFSSRKSGFTRIINLGKRRGDNSDLVIFEFTEIKKREIKKPKKNEEVLTQGNKETVTESKTTTETAVKEKPPVTKKPTKKLLGGFKNIFKKERDSL